MTARKPFTKRDRTRLSEGSFGHRPRNNWGAGDLPAPWAVGDLVDIPPDALNERMASRGIVAGPAIVTDAYSIGEGDEWYFRVTDGHRRVDGRWGWSDRLHVIPDATPSPIDWMAGVVLLETADPDGLALRNQMLADGWAYTPPPTCPTCGQDVRP